MTSAIRPAPTCAAVNRVFPSIRSSALWPRRPRRKCVGRVSHSREDDSKNRRTEQPRRVRGFTDAGP